LPTFTSVEVMPVWSLKALAGGGGRPVPLLPAAVVVVVELVELQATPVVATSMTIPSAAKILSPQVFILHYSRWQPLSGYPTSALRYNSWHHFSRALSFLSQ